MNIEENSNITLNCEFNIQVLTCVWYRNKAVVNIINRYYYVSNGGENTKNCSIIIQNVAKRDQADWHCSSMSSSHSEGTRSQSARVIVKS